MSAAKHTPGSHDPLNTPWAELRRAQRIAALRAAIAKATGAA